MTTPASSGPEPVAAELEALRPYLGLAREIRDAVERFVDDEQAPRLLYRARYYDRVAET